MATGDRNSLAFHLVEVWTLVYAWSQSFKQESPCACTRLVRVWGLPQSNNISYIAIPKLVEQLGVCDKQRLSKMRLPCPVTIGNLCPFPFAKQSRREWVCLPCSLESRWVEVARAFSNKHAWLILTGWIIWLWFVGHFVTPEPSARQPSPSPSRHWSPQRRLVRRISFIFSKMMCMTWWTSF